MAAVTAIAARGAYGAAFIFVLPILLVGWARAAPVDLPVPHLPGAGLLIAAGGAVLMAAGWLALLIDGGGLPMNAFPPPRHATRGPYTLCAHPIYVGFCAAAAGVALLAHSAAGLWLVTPAIALACAALVLGHERHSLRARFGDGRARPILSLPAPSADAAAPRDRAAMAILLAVPWAVLYGAVVTLGPAPDAIATWLPFEEVFPVVEEAELVYVSTYPFVLLALFAPRSKADARRLAVRGLLSIALVFPLYFLLPFQAPPRAFAPHSPLGHLLLAEQALDTAAGAFPSFHVLWALIAAQAWAERAPRAGRLAWAWAALIAASCWLTGMHSLLDVLAACGAFAVVLRAPRIWEALRRWSERMANRWREWRVGPVRILEYGAWAAFANLVGVAIVSAVIGPGHVRLVMITASAGIAGALVAGQVLDRPAPEARPFGFYGGLLGILLSAAAAAQCGTPRQEIWLLLAGYCAAGPFVQALGRVRCLMQGCCHGRLAPEAIGIRCSSSLSRVCRAGLEGVPLHPTPLYSILWNLLVGAVGLRFWSLGVPAPFVCGVYLMLNGLGRFVEESYRGEPSTQVVAGLRIYQWFAAATLLCGGALTALSGPPVASPRLDLHSAAAAVIFAAVTWLAYGVDFPGKRFRFARLA